MLILFLQLFYKTFFVKLFTKSSVLKLSDNSKWE